MTSNPCTVGAIRGIFSKTLPADKAAPVVQVLQIKAIPPKPNAPERFRAVLSDSSNFVQSMLASQANGYVHSGEISKGGFIRLTSYHTNNLKDKKVLIVIALDPLPEYGVQEKVGNPVSMEDGQYENERTTPAPPPAQQTNPGSFYNKPAEKPSRPAGNTRQAHPGGAGGAGMSQSANIYPIEAISPYQNKWTIKARVTSKPPKKEWSNGNSEGKLFSVNLLDETGEIRATGFNDDCDRLYDELEEGQVYYISKARVKMAKRQYTNINNDYELMFTRDTEIERCTEPDVGVPQMRFNFVKISDLGGTEKDATIDVIGIVKDAGETGEIISKNTHKPHKKREVTIVDDSETMVRVTVWGDTAINWNYPPDTIVAFKGLKVSDFGGRSLSMSFSSSMVPAPDIEEAHSLKGWYEAQGSSKDLSSFSTHQNLAGMGTGTGRPTQYKNLGQVRDENIGMGSEPVYFTVKATIVYIKHENVSYPACLNEGCNKKVIIHDEGTWRCEKCSANHPKPQYRYIITLSVNDPFGQAWLSCFDEVGRMIMGKSADELEELKQEMDSKPVEDTFTNALCQTYNFRCKARQDTYDGTPRVRYQILEAKPLDYVAEAVKLVETIKLYSQD